MTVVAELLPPRKTTPPPIPDAHQLLGPNETIIDTHFMQQLLSYGISLGRQNDNSKLDDPAALADEAQVLPVLLQCLG
jgi:hypothetical protein